MTTPTGHIKNIADARESLRYMPDDLRDQIFIVNLEKTNKDIPALAIAEIIREVIYVRKASKILFNGIDDEIEDRINAAMDILYTEGWVDTHRIVKHEKN